MFYIKIRGMPEDDQLKNGGTIKVIRIRRSLKVWINSLTKRYRTFLSTYFNSFLKVLLATQSPAIAIAINTKVSRHRKEKPTPFKKISFRIVT